MMSDQRRAPSSAEAAREPGDDPGSLFGGPPRNAPPGDVHIGRAARREQAMAAKRSRRRRRRSIVLLLGLTGVVVFLLANIGKLPIPGVGGDVLPGRQVRVTIPQGASTRQIARLLADAEVIERSGAFQDAAVSRGVDGKLKPGEYVLLTAMDENELFTVLTTGPSATSDRITFPEGLTVRQITDRMTKGGRWSKAEIAKAMADPSLTSPYRPKGKPLEGLLYPATYDLGPGDKPGDLLREMLDELDEVMAGQDLDAARRLKLSNYEILIVASMIEREARVAEDRPKVARVIYNRLKAKRALQIDATIQYALSKPKPRLSTADLRIRSPYNTYARPGLPPTPIAAPGQPSIAAALDPADGPWLYYVVTAKDGRHTFTADYQEFLRLKAKAQKAGFA
jgi:UPF0755 protein